MGIDTVDKQTGGITAFCEATPTLSTDAYISGDLLFDVTELTDAVRVDVGTGILHSIVVIDDDDKKSDFDLFVTRSSTTWGTVNDAWGIADAIAGDVLYHTEIVQADYYDMINGQRAQIVNIGVGVKAESGSSSLYIAGVSRDTDTFSVSGLTFMVTILAD